MAQGIAIYAHMIATAITLRVLQGAGEYEESYFSRVSMLILGIIDPIRYRIFFGQSSRISESKRCSNDPSPRVKERGLGLGLKSS